MQKVRCNLIPNYWICLFTRDGARSLSDTVRSLNAQTHKPVYMIAVDDGSTDETSEILANEPDFRKYIVQTHSTSRDVRRAYHLVNLALKAARQIGCPPYMMISGDDCFYPPNYAAEALKRMSEDPRTVVASGTWIHDLSPTGSGRFVSMRFMQEIGGEYPKFYGWESWLTLKAQQLGYDLKVYQDLRYKHLRSYAPRQLRGWGAVMWFFGYPFYDVLYRFFYMITLPLSKRQVHTSGLFALLAGYFVARIRKEDQIQDLDFQHFIRYKTTRNIGRFLPKHILRAIHLR